MIVFAIEKQLLKSSRCCQKNWWQNVVVRHRAHLCNLASELSFATKLYDSVFQFSNATQLSFSAMQLSFLTQPCGSVFKFSFELSLMTQYSNSAPNSA